MVTSDKSNATNMRGMHFVYEPRGQHQVGAFDLVTPGKGDSSSADRQSDDAPIDYGVLARVYYPTLSPVGTGHQYVEPHYVIGMTVNFMRWGHWFGRLMSWASKRLRMCCSWLGDLLPGAYDERLPMIIFSHGLGGQRMVYSSLAIELASHGFIVASVEHRDGSASMTFTPDAAAAAKGELHQNWLPFVRHPLDDHAFRNRQVKQRAYECQQLTEVMLQLDRSGTVPNWLPCGGLTDELLMTFKDRIDANRIHIIGHSFGAATALTVAATDKRAIYKTCCAHDPWMLPVDMQVCSNIKLPTLFLHNEQFHWETNVKRIRAVQEGIEEGKWTNLTIRGTKHTAQSDGGLYLSPWLNRKMGMCLSLEPADAIEISAKCSLRFIDRHEGRELNDDSKKLLNGEDPSCFADFSFVPDTNQS